MAASAEADAARPRVLVNTAGATSGGGITWSVAVLQELGERGTRGVDWHFVVPPQLKPLLPGAPIDHLRITIRRAPSPTARLAWEQLALPGRVDDEHEVLISAGNFGPLSRGDRHILLARNALHFDEGSRSGRAGLRLRAESALARQSVKRAALTITATKSMADSVARHTKRRAAVLPFGPGLVAGRLDRERPRFTFLHRTGYGVHKRLGDIMHAARELAQAGHAGDFVVLSACDPRTPFARRFAESAYERKLMQDSGVREHVTIEPFAPRPRELLDGDAVIMPSTRESFCFPIAEAIGADLPVIAAESRFARELCGESAFYVTPRNVASLAAAMRRVLNGERPPPFTSEIRRRISWITYVDQLAAICRGWPQRNACPG